MQPIEINYKYEISNFGYKSLKHNYFKSLLLIARPCYVKFILRKQKQHNTEMPPMFILHDILKKLKKNLPIHEKAENAEPGLSTRSLRSLSLLLRLKLQICFGAFKVFSGLQVFERSDTILSWHRPRSPGNDFGNVYGK